MAPRFPEPGEIFERQYRIEAKAGRGGFARIYRAVQQQLERDVALKILKPKPHDDLDPHHRDEFQSQVVQRFHREARNVAQLRDPHTVTLYDYGQTQTGLFYMVFEFIDGRTLKFCADRGQPIDQERVVDILQKVLSSLEEAHTLGMLHRDIKPANIMLYDYIGRTDQVKVLDFGISKAVLHNASVTLKNLTREHVMMGTPRYMSPEQLRGDRIGPPSDLYSLGLVAFELLAGRQAVDDEQEADIINKQISPQPLTLPDGVQATDTLRATIHRMLAKDQQERFHSVDELQEALAAWNSPRGFPWEKEWLAPSFNPAARDEPTDVEQMFPPMEGDGPHRPLPTRQDEIDGTHRPVPTRRDELPPGQMADQEEAGGYLSALLLGVVSTLAVVGAILAVWSPWQSRETVDLSQPTGGDVTSGQQANAEPAAGETMTIQTQPPGADIRIDGRLIGQSPVSVPTGELDYPVIVHAERNDGTRLVQRVTYPTETISLDFAVISSDEDRADAGTADTTGTPSDTSESVAAKETTPDTGSSPSESPEQPDTGSASPSSNDDSRQEDDRENPSDDSSDQDDSDKGGSSDDSTSDDSTSAEKGPEVIPLIDDDSDDTAGGDETSTDDEQNDSDGSDDSSSSEHEFPPLDE